MWHLIPTWEKKYAYAHMFLYLPALQLGSGDHQVMSGKDEATSGQSHRSAGVSLKNQLINDYQMQDSVQQLSPKLWPLMYRFVSVLLCGVPQDQPSCPAWTGKRHQWQSDSSEDRWQMSSSEEHIRRYRLLQRDWKTGPLVSVVLCDQILTVLFHHIKQLRTISHVCLNQLGILDWAVQLNRQSQKSLWTSGNWLSADLFCPQTRFKHAIMTLQPC